jgi:hypothetical protein
LENLGLGQVGSLDRNVCIADTRFGGGEAGDLRLGQVDGVLQIVLAGTDATLNQSEVADRGGERSKCAQGVAG